MVHAESRHDWLQASYPEAGFGGFTRCDSTVALYSRINALVTSESHVLDLGCGRGAHFDPGAPCPYRVHLRMLRGRVARVVGIDVDPVGEENPSLDEFRHITDLDHWPVEDASIDLVMSDFVVEHVDDPGSFFAEVSRVLRPGGTIAIRTPNRWSYVSLAASLIPNRLHGSVVSRVQSAREEKDVFPVRYRCNSRRSLRRAMTRAGLESAVWTMESEPAYFAFSRSAYRLGTMIHSVMPPGLRTTLLGFGRKPLNG